MPFFKSLLLAIFATLFLTYVLGSSLMETFDVNIYMGDNLVDPLKAISVSALITLLLALVAIAIVMSVFGGIIFIGLLILGSFIMVAIGVFWPILLIAIIIWLFSRNKQSPQT
jgi:hypothetical protein